MRRRRWAKSTTHGCDHTTIVRGPQVVTVQGVVARPAHVVVPQTGTIPTYTYQATAMAPSAP